MGIIIGTGGRSRGGGEPTAYIKDASVENEVLTLTKKDDTTVLFDQSGKEDKNNKVTSLSSSSTDTEYPSAKAVYDTIQSEIGSFTNFLGFFASQSELPSSPTNPSWALVGTDIDALNAYVYTTAWTQFGTKTYDFTNYAGTVRYNAGQTLTSEQQAQARENINLNGTMEGVEAMRSHIDELGDAHAKSIDMDELPKVCHFPWIIKENKAPDVAPDFVPQIWIDMAAGKVYVATGTANASSFKALN